MLSDIQVLVEPVIRDFLEMIKTELIAYMDSENRNATGKSKASIQVINLTGATGQLVGSESIEYVFRGRPPGKMPPLIKIIDWCNARGLPRSVAWVIAKRISEAGTKLFQSGRNIFNEIITQEKIDTFTKSIADIYVARVNSDISSILAAA